MSQLRRPRAVALTAGSKLGPYKILAPLGAGGMGEVYRARDPRLDREVAVKILPEARSQDPTRQARFDREARSLAAQSLETGERQMIMSGEQDARPRNSTSSSTGSRSWRGRWVMRDSREMPSP